MCSIFRIAPQDFAFDTEIKFKIDGGLNGHLKVQEMKLKLSLKALDVSKWIIKVIRLFFLSLFLNLRNLAIFAINCYDIAYKISTLYCRKFLREKRYI